MLAKHFEGVEPGPAHERLADLAAGGVIKVFITTNFDRLLERAIEARGIDPVVVSDDATLAAAPRREHSRVFIIKAHGDYLQETIRNTPSELATLDPKLTEELRIIANHYGLLVLGWRGADPALAEIVRGSVTRYGAWWLSRSEQPGEPTQTLIATIGARKIVRPAGAGEFLAELQRRLSVYEAYETGDDPASVHDEVLSLIKRDEEVELDEVLRRERWAFESALEAIRAEGAPSGQDTSCVKRRWGLSRPSATAHRALSGNLGVRSAARAAVYWPPPRCAHAARTKRIGHEFAGDLARHVHKVLPHVAAVDVRACDPHAQTSTLLFFVSPIYVSAAYSRVREAAMSANDEVRFDMAAL